MPDVKIAERCHRCGTPIVPCDCGAKGRPHWAEATQQWCNGRYDGSRWCLGAEHLHAPAEDHHLSRRP